MTDVGHRRGSELYRVRAIFGCAGAIVVAFAATGCGASAAARAPSTSAPACVASSRTVCINRGGESAVHRAHVGETVKVVLADSLRWSGPRATNGAVLREVGTPATVRGNYVVTYKAVGQGKASIELTGAPICTQHEACPQFILLWRTTVTVVK